MTEHGVAAARDAMTRSAWTDAYERFGALDAAGALDSEDLVVYAEAATWCSLPDRCLELNERAFDAFMAGDQRTRAADIALEIARKHIHSMRTAMVSGWMRRAEQLLADQAEC